MKRNRTVREIEENLDIIGNIELVQLLNGLDYEREEVALAILRLIRINRRIVSAWDMYYKNLEDT